MKMKKKIVVDKSKQPIVKPEAKPATEETKHDGYVIYYEGSESFYRGGKLVDDINEATLFCIPVNAQAKADAMKEREGFEDGRVVPVKRLLEMVEE